VTLAERGFTLGQRRGQGGVRRNRLDGSSRGKFDANKKGGRQQKEKGNIHSMLLRGGTENVKDLSEKKPPVQWKEKWVRVDG